MSVASFVPAILALGFLIVVHEAGHYVVARWCGMRVERFSIGFGPGILKRRGKSGTIFQLAPIPFGGFVEIRGMNIAEEVDPDDVQAYPNRPAWQRFVTIFAGPATNYISAVLLAMVLYTCHGMGTAERYAYVSSVLEKHDAAGKLQQDDRIVAVEGVPLVVNDPDELGRRVNAKKGAPVTLTIMRGRLILLVSIQPKLYKDEKTGEQQFNKDGSPKYLLGIAPYSRPDLAQVGVATAAWGAIKFPVEQSIFIGKGLYGIISGSEKADPGGPIRIVQEFRKAFTSSWAHGIELLMLLSVYLGLFNLLPLPALDGGRLVFLGYELVTRRRANPKIEAMVHMGGIMLLGIVMILVTLKDCNVL